MVRRVVTEEIRQEIKVLLENGRTIKEIAEYFNFSTSTIREHASFIKNPEIMPISRKRKDVSCLRVKVTRFLRDAEDAVPFTPEELLALYPEPRCYITGKLINLEEPSTYNLDHFIPRGKGGKSIIENCRFATRDANMSKSDLSYEEYISLAKTAIQVYEQNKPSLIERGIEGIKAIFRSWSSPVYSQYY